VAAFFKKNASLSNPEVCESTAFSSFLKAEERCRITNKRLEHYWLNRDRLDPDVNRKLVLMERYIHRVLGDFNQFLEELPQRIRLTGGATATRGRRKSLPYLKVGMRVTCTQGAEPYLQALSQYYGYGPLECRFISWNRITTVLKNWETNRTIACEPDGNMPLQLAFDNYSKERLRKFGINLRSQSKNQELARLGSLSDDIATIDEREASDSTAFNAVAWLFPQEWFNFVNSIRSPQYKFDKHVGTYAKFSSMGNGTTFCIETLIFAAACHAVGSKIFSVYGDDIIVESELAQELIALLAFVGFRTNEQKSFIKGPFRESCGTDWFKGENVTPFFIRCDPKRKSEWCHFVNGLALISRPSGKLWEYLRKLVKERNLPYVPFNLDSLSGVWIDIHSAYSLKLVQSRSHILKFKGFTVKCKTRRNRGVRSAFLWHLASYKKRIVAPSAFTNSESMLVMSEDWFVPTGTYDVNMNEVSSVPSFDYKYVRKWVCWIPPAMVVPDHLHWWSDYMIRASES
jgi:hypothetical protein